MLFGGEGEDGRAQKLYPLARLVFQRMRWSAFLRWLRLDGPSSATASIQTARSYFNEVHLGIAIDRRVSPQ